MNQPAAFTNSPTKRLIPLLGRRLPEFYLLLALSLTILLSFVTPPFFGPDEANQSLRASTLSHGAVMATMQGEEAGGFADTGVVSAMEEVNHLRMQWEQKGGDFHRRPWGAVHTAQLAPLKQRRWSGRLAYVEFNNTASYPPLLFLPDAVGWRTAEALHWTVFAGLRTARLLSAVCAVMLGWLALRAATGTLRFALFALLMLPSELFLNACCSQDACLLALVCGAVALVARALDENRQLRLRQLALASCAFGLCAMARPPYAALCLLLFVPGFQLPRRAGRMTKPVIAFTTVLLLVFAWRSLVAHLGFENSDEANPELQALFVRDHPFATVAALLRGTAEAAKDFLERGWYVMGWDALVAPVVLRTIAGLALVATLLPLHPRRLRATSRIVATAGFILPLLGIAAAEYIIWTPPGLSTVYGITPRYWLPVLPALALLLTNAARQEQQSAPFYLYLRDCLLLGGTLCSVLVACTLPAVAAHAFYAEPLLTLLHASFP